MSRFDQYLSGNETPKDLCTEIDKLEEQIEKMKPYCKHLCKNYSKFTVMGNDCANGVCRSCNKWESAV